MRDERRTELRVGIFVLSALFIGTSVAWIIGSNRNMFESKVSYHAVFDTVGGLRKGSPVRLAGVAVGAVKKVAFRETGRISVTFTVAEGAHRWVRKGSIARIGNKGLLGDQLVNISVGSGSTLPEGTQLPSQEPVNMGRAIEQAGSILNEVEATARNLHKASEPLASAEFTDDIRTVVHNFRTISELATDKQGTLYRVLTDPKMSKSIGESAADLRTTVAEFARASQSARRILYQVENGKGLVHALLYDPDGEQVVSGFANAANEVAAVLEGLRKGKGAGHELLYGDEGESLIANLRAASTDVRAITADLRAGKGTAGALLTDPSLYEDLKRLVGDLERNEVLRALVRYSIRADEQRQSVNVESSAE